MEIQMKDAKTEREAYGEAYGMALQKNWRGFWHCFKDQSPQELLKYKTVSGDSPFHIAAGSGNYKLLKRLLDKLPEEQQIEALLKKDIHGNTVLHEAAINDCVDAAKELVKILRASDRAELNNLLIRNALGETPLYRAAALGQTKTLQYLATQVGNLTRHFHRDDKISILHIAVIGQHFDIAIWLLKKDEQLANYKTGKETQGETDDENSMTALQLLALMPSTFRSTSPMGVWKSFFYSCIPVFLNNDDDYKRKEDLETGETNSSVCQSKKLTAISKMHDAFWGHVIEGCPALKKIWKEKQKHRKAVELVKLLVHIDISWQKKADHLKEVKEVQVEPTLSLGLGKGSMTKETKLAETSPEKLVDLLEKKYTSLKNTKKREVDVPATDIKSSLAEIPLGFAASNGIIEIFDEIIKVHPQAIDYINDKGQNVLHVAILYRQDKIFESIKNLEMAVPKLASRIDNNGCTILHHVAETKFYRGGTRSGPALQFQEELEWFERVKDIMPSHYAMHRNKKMITASDLFEETHAGQLKKAQNWIKETAQSCSTLAILVATVVFAAAYTVPGGNDDEGYPHLLHLKLFYVFAIMDVVSLGLSLSSVVMFLSILTSPFESGDFLRSLPKKLTVGFTFLFFSVLTSMITFSASLLLIIRLGKKGTVVLYSAAFFPVVVLALIQFPFYVSFLGNLKNYCKELTKIFPRKKHREEEII